MYSVHADLNSDGVVDFGELMAVIGGGPTAVEGRVSLPSVRSVVGYAGYIHDPAAGPDGGCTSLGIVGWIRRWGGG